MLAFLALFMFFQAPAPQPAALQGIVVREGTRQPIQGAVVSVVRDGGSPRTGTSGEDGRFGIADLVPGRYTINVTRAGFVRSRQSSGPVHVTLAPGEQLGEVRIQLAPTAVITGRVLDDNRNPILGAPVTLYGVQYENGRRILSAVRAVNRAQTDDRGEYRIFGVPEGEYYVETFASDFPSTYYPGVTDLGDAISVTAPAGMQVSGIDFRLTRQQRYSAHLKLVLPAQQASGPIVGMYILRQHRNGVVGMDSVNMAVPPQSARSGGSPEPRVFTTPPLAPGSYIAVYDAGSYAGRLAFDIIDRDVDAGTMVINPGIALSGKLQLAGSAPAGWTTDRVQVVLRPLDLRGSLTGLGMQSRVASDGTFLLAMPEHTGRAPSVAQGRYQVEILGLAGDLYLASARLAGFDALENGLNIDGSSSGPLELTIQNGGAIEGVVSNEKNEPAADATVALLPTRERLTNLLLFKNTVTDQQGRYILRGVAPGEYTVVAWEDVPTPPEYVSASERHGTRVIVSGTATASASVRVIKR